MLTQQLDFFWNFEGVKILLAYSLFYVVIVIGTQNLKFIA